MWKLKYGRGKFSGRLRWFVYKRWSFIGIFTCWELMDYFETEEEAYAFIKSYPQPDQKVISL